MKKEEIIKIILGDEARIVSPILGGMMNNSYLVNYQNKQYILYIATEQANEMVDRKEELNHLEMVYELGITSKNIYFDVSSGIKINEFIPGNSLNHLQEFDVSKIAAVLKTLHESGLKSNLDYKPFERFLGFEKEAKQHSSLDETYSHLRKIIFDNRDYLTNVKQVLSHNDFQKSNIVRSEDDHYCMIDFEFMANNAEHYDIACFGNDKVEEGFALLKAYFGENLTDDDIKRFYLWRIFISLQWFLVAIIKHYRGEGKAHQIDFLSVANHFINNALEVEKNLIDKMLM